MSDFVVLGTDTDAGKTTFALLWLAAFADRYGYWKPLETGESDSERVRRLVPAARVLPPIARFDEPVAPPLAARRVGRVIPPAAEIAAARPPEPGPVLVETFGGPLSPLNETELQAALVREFGLPCVLVSSSAVGAVTRTLATLRQCRVEGLAVRAVVLIGPRDDYAVEQIGRHGTVDVASFRSPMDWTADGVASASREQQSALETILAAVTLTSPSSADASDLQARDARAVWHPYTSLRDDQPPLPVVAAQDEFLELADGRRLIDGISSWWTVLHGHRDPPLMDALRRASERIDHVLFAGATHPDGVAVAEHLLRTVPWSGGRVFFSDNGSTAVEVALKMAYQAWCHRGESQRQLFVAFEGGYHGDTFGAMAVGRDPLFFGRFEPLLFRTLQVPVSPDHLDAALREHAGEVAGVIVEPLVQAAGGMRMHSPETQRDLFAVARRHGVWFVADEVMTCGRTGTFWAHEQAGISPDLICAAKTLAGGILPLAVTLASPDVVREFDVPDRQKTFFHGHSFTGHPLACAVAAENLARMAHGHWRADADRIRRRWLRAADELRNLPGVTDVRVCGTVLAADVGGPGQYLAPTGRAMRQAALNEGVLLRPLGNVLYALPPLRTSDTSLDQIVRAMTAAVGAMPR